LFRRGACIVQREAGGETLTTPTASGVMFAATAIASLAPGTVMTAEPTPAATTIPLPPSPRLKVSIPSRTARTIARLDAVLVGLLLLFGFVLALFTAPNTDFWMHLGAGKLLLQGQYHLGTDPFAHTTADALWVNHAWMFDLLTYLFYQTFGGASLIVAKALMLAFLAGVMLWASQRQGGWWLSVVCIALAVLAVSRWFLVQPVGVSCVLFALTFAFLQRRSDAARGGMLGITNYWPLLLLFVLWVNLDNWFLLGPLAVAIAGLGTYLDGDRARARTLGAVLLLSLVACLLNPHHIRAFMLPEQLGLTGAGRVLRGHALFAGQFLSPLDKLYYRPEIGLNAAGMSYFALVGVSLASFVINRAGWRWQRFLFWIVMLLLSLFSVRAIPFFAVVAGPIAAINIGEAGVHRAATSFFNGRSWAIGGRVVCVLGGVALVACAWPGWLQALPPEPRSWNVEADASVQRTATLLAEWRRTGKLGPEDRGFNASMDVANHLAFSYSGERSFFDQRPGLFSPDVAADFLTIRQGLVGSKGEDADQETSRGNWREVLRGRHVTHVILHDNKLARSAALFRRLMANSREWALLHLEGRTAVFGWLDPANPKSNEMFAAMQMEALNRRAFHPAEAERAPAHWPGRDPDPQWWNRYLSAAPSRTPETDEATLWLSAFDDLRPVYFDHHLRSWTNAQIAGAVAIASGGDATAATPLGQVLHSIMADFFLLNPRRVTTEGEAPTRTQVSGLQLMNEWFMQQDDAPMALPLLAIRAARRAIHANPDDAYAYLALGEAYVRLSQQTRERTALRRMAFLDRIRKVQAVTAFNHALLLNPNLAQAHARLADYYTELRYADLVLKHRKELLRLTRAGGPHPGESSEAFERRRDELQKHVSELDDDVREMLNVFEVNATNLKIVPRAQQAQARGLGGKALDILKASDITAFGKAGLEMELELLLTTGGIREFRAWFNPLEHRSLLSEPSAPYATEWYLVYLAAASGNYDDADANLAAMNPSLSFRAQTLPLIGQAFLDVNPQAPSLVSALQAARIRERLRRHEAMWGLQQLYRADLTALRGLLALERGDGERAAAMFQEALAIADAAAVASPGAKTEFSGRFITEACLELIAP
jgi:hypothetical protein